MKNALLLFILFFVLGCSKDDPEIVMPPESAFSDEQLSNAALYSEEKGGFAVVIMENGNTIFENYHNDGNENTSSHIRSATKLFWSAAVALAKQQGIINDYEENVSNTIVEWQDNNIHPNKNQIKIKHLLTLSSGLSQNLFPISNNSDRYQYVIDELDVVNSPGDQFSYGPSNYYVLGALLQKRLNNAGISQNPLEYLETQIFDKIGLEYENWSYDQSGNPNIPNGCDITPINFIKFGQFLLNKGQWNQEQIIEPRFLEEMLIPTGPNPGHGNFCWLNSIGGFGLNANDTAPIGSEGGMIYHNGYPEIIGGLGAGKNRMYLIPSLNVVIVRQTLLEDDTFDDSEFLAFLLD